MYDSDYTGPVCATATTTNLHSCTEDVTVVLRIISVLERLDVTLGYGYTILLPAQCTDTGVRAESGTRSNRSVSIEGKYGTTLHDVEAGQLTNNTIGNVSGLLEGCHLVARKTIDQLFILIALQQRVAVCLRNVHLVHQALCFGQIFVGECFAHTNLTLFRYSHISTGSTDDVLGRNHIGSAICLQTGHPAIENVITDSLNQGLDMIIQNGVGLVIADLILFMPRDVSRGGREYIQSIVDERILTLNGLSRERGAVLHYLRRCTGLRNVNYCASKYEGSFNYSEHQEGVHFTKFLHDVIREDLYGDFGNCVTHVQKCF